VRIRPRSTFEAPAVSPINQLSAWLTSA
jgi:hypothetical protein